MATAKKKKTKSIGQVSYLTKQVASLEKDLVRKDIEKLDQKVDGVKTELSNKIEKLDQKVDNLETNLNIKIDSVKTELKQDIKHLKSNNKIILGILGVGFTALFTAIFYLHSDTKQDINSLKQDINSINTKLDRLIERDLRK